MKRNTAMTIIALLALGEAYCASGSLEFSRYQVILDRMPFGEKEAEVIPVAPVEPAQPPFAQSTMRNLKLCALKQDRRTGKVRVGFIDKKAKPEKTYFLYVGETSSDGIEVADADFVEEKALLRQDGQEYWLYMTGWAEPGGGGLPNAATPASQARAPTPPSRGHTGTTASTSRTSTSGAAASRGSYLERLRQRREALAKRNEAIIKSRMQQPSATAVQAKLEKYNMQLIREGKPALPIPLTKAQDDQLVHEGALPPAGP